VLTALEVMEARGILPAVEKECRRCGVTLGDILSMRGKEGLTTKARHHAWLALLAEGFPAAQVARMWGCDHTSVLYAVRKARKA